jgi:hypothetical protein
MGEIMEGSKRFENVSKLLRVISKNPAPGKYEELDIVQDAIQ